MVEFTLRLVSEGALEDRHRQDFLNAAIATGAQIEYLARPMPQSWNFDSLELLNADFAINVADLGVVAAIILLPKSETSDFPMTLTRWDGKH